MTSSKPVIPKKEWITTPRESHEYFKGVESFIHFLILNRANLGGKDCYSCPCVKCHNSKGMKVLHDIFDHLICSGIYTTYTTWIHHREPFIRPEGNTPTRMHSTSNNEDTHPRMIEMVNDRFRHLHNEGNVKVDRIQWQG
ncbi:hypothetical protein GIB67_004805 [Kingdonia uniflora]|uniref:Transposase-associated domain-containing protein n=1 Tax=Kingdonia uniflora TaxID=39325 RepID=A0A7J7LNK0_9MAGN|nr:hypothetical protein GIB67_004805 [Kingdonia uniflora]